MGIGCALAGLAGGSLAPAYNVSSGMGNNVIATVLLMTMLGGMDSLLGAVVGGLIVGEILSFGQYYFGQMSIVVSLPVHRHRHLLPAQRAAGPPHGHGYLTREDLSCCSHKRLLGFIVLAVFFALVPLWVQSPYYIDLLIVVMINAGSRHDLHHDAPHRSHQPGHRGLLGHRRLCVGHAARSTRHLSFWACLPLATLITAVVGARSSATSSSGTPASRSSS